MSIPEEDIIDVTPTALSTNESLFVVNVFKGLGTTMRHALQNFGRGGANKDTIWVVQYPEQKRMSGFPAPPRGRRACRDPSKSYRRRLK